MRKYEQPEIVETFPFVNGTDPQEVLACAEDQWGLERCEHGMAMEVDPCFDCAGIEFYGRNAWDEMQIEEARHIVETYNDEPDDAD